MEGSWTEKVRVISLNRKLHQSEKHSWAKLCSPKFVCCSPDFQLTFFGNKVFKEVIKMRL